MKTLATVLLVGLSAPLQAAPPPSALEAPVRPRSPLEVRSAVVSMIERPGAFPYEAEWKPLGPAALGVLEELAANPEAPAPQRSRAVTFMAAVDHPEASGRLRALLEDTTALPSLRASAATALGLRTGAEAVSTLLPFLQDSSAPVREAVARSLGRLGGPQARQALEDRLTLEETLLVREALQQGLTFIEP